MYLGPTGMLYIQKNNFTSWLC